MFRNKVVLLFLSLLLISFQLEAAPPKFKKKMFYGPIPFNSLNMSVGFLSGPSANHLTEYLNQWAKDRNGQDIFSDISNSPFIRIGYDRQISPNILLRGSVSLSYLKNTSYGYYYAESDTANFLLHIRRTFKIYLLGFEGGLLYYFIPPDVQHFSPYIGGGYAAVVPLSRLDTDSFTDGGTKIDVPGENVSRNSLEAGLHSEFGMVYFMTNRYAAAVEGRYQMSQSKFYIHNYNFDIDYSGFSLSMNFYYYF